MFSLRVQKKEAEDPVLLNDMTSFIIELKMVILLSFHFFFYRSYIFLCEIVFKRKNINFKIQIFPSSPTYGLLAIDQNSRQDFNLLCAFEYWVAIKAKCIHVFTVSLNYIRETVNSCS